MRRFLLAAFRISFFELIVLVLFTALKYFFTKFRVIDAIRGPLIWICAGAAILFFLSIITLGFMGKLDEPDGTRDESMSKPRHNWLGNVASWGMTIPILLGYSLFLYFLMPTTFSMAIALYCGIIIRNIFEYFSVRKGVPSSNEAGL